MNCCGFEHVDYEDYDFDTNPLRESDIIKQDILPPPPTVASAGDINIEAGFERCHQCKTQVFLKRDPGQRYCGEVCRYWAKKKRQGKYDKIKYQ